MPILAVALVLVSAGLHLYWNALVKVAKDPTSFSHQLQGIGSLLALPFGLVLGWGQWPEPRPWGCAALSGVCYAIYYCALAGSYRLGQISVAYPIVRGVAPATAALAGIALYHDRPSPLAGIGILSVWPPWRYLGKRESQLPDRALRAPLDWPFWPGWHRLGIY